MNAEADLPIGSVDWTTVRDLIDGFIVIETTEMFFARRAKDKQGVYSIEVPESDKVTAHPWLRQEAARDREDYAGCRCCGHVIHRKLPTAPFCGILCRDFEP